MATPLPIPASGNSGGSYWPTSGSVPKANTSTYYVLTDDTAVSGAWLLQASSDPGVDPIDLGTLPIIRPGGWIYIPSLNTVHQVQIVRQPVEGYGVDGLTATLVFMAGEDPVGMVAATPTDIRVIDMGFVPMKIQNIGGANVTIDGATFISGQFFKATTPITYAAGGSILSFIPEF